MKSTGNPRKRGRPRKSLPPQGNSPRQRGRPPKFKPEMVNFATNMCLLGANNAELARAFEVDERTISHWIANNPDFSQAVKEGRELADARVARSLYQKALNGDVAAAFIWLKNRQPARWRDKKEVHETRDETRRVTVELSERAKQHVEELRQLLFRDDDDLARGDAPASPSPAGNEANGVANGRSGNGSVH